MREYHEIDNGTSVEFLPEYTSRSSFISLESVLTLKNCDIRSLQELQSADLAVLLVESDDGDAIFDVDADLLRVGGMTAGLRK
jgi:hypothetical protein